MNVPFAIRAEPGPKLSDSRAAIVCRFDEGLQKWPQPGTGVHGHIMRLANLARRAGLSEEEAIEQISAAMPRAASPSTEVDDAVHKAYQGDEWQPGTGEEKIKFLPDTQRAFIARGKDGSEDAWRRKSPVTITSEASA